MVRAHMCVCVCVCTRSCLTPFHPWPAAQQAPLSMGFSRQEYWGGLPFPSPRDLPNPGVKPVSLASPALAGRFFTTVPPGKQVEHNFLFFTVIFNADKGVNPEYLLEGLILMLKLQYVGELLQRTISLEKTLMLGKVEGRRRSE